MYESGVYMSSVAATVFVASLVTVGVLMLTLLLAITFMLNSCQGRSSGDIQHVRMSDEYELCNAFASHAELNDMDMNEFPTICKQFSLAYENEGRFLRDLNLSVQLAESYFSTLEPDDEHLDVILMDVDGIVLPGDSNSTRDWYMI